MFARILMITGLVSAGLLLILLTTTTPAKVGAFGILAIFLLSYVLVLIVTTFLLWCLALVMDNVVNRVRGISRKSYAMDLKRAYYFSTVIALGPVILVSLHSVGGIGIYDVGLVALFLALGCLYVSRRTT